MSWIHPMTGLWNDESDVDWGEIGDTPERQALAFSVMLRSLRGETHRVFGKLRTRAIRRDEANRFIEHVHRHHGKVPGWKFAAALEDDVSALGLIVVGRPVSRHQDDGRTLEVTRCAVMSGVRNGASLLLGMAARTARELGYRRIITYTLTEEDGASLRAAGFTQTATNSGGSWDTPTRRRTDKAPTTPKRRWEREL